MNETLNALAQTEVQSASESAGDLTRVCVIGLGYIGLPTAAMFASRKIEVVGVDVNPLAVETVNRGEVHIQEPDLDIIVRATVADGWLRATEQPEPADAFLIAVPTPFREEHHDPDLSYIEAAVHAIAPVLKRGDLVVLESTVPVGTTETMESWLSDARPDLTFPSQVKEDADIRIAHCPERVLPGRVMLELISNDRIVGGITSACAAKAAELYQTFVTGECLVTDVRTAEMAKLTENSFRDVNIAFANELSIVCDRLGIDVWDLIRLSNRHPRVNILEPGPGVGGHCIAVDPWFIVASVPDEARLIRTAREVNDSKPGWVLTKIREAIGAHLMENPETSASDVTICCWGLTFKPDIDDLRESPALNIVERLAAEHPGKVLVVEPNINELPEHLDASIATNRDPTPDIQVMLVDHSAFKRLPRPRGILVDARGVWRNR